MSPGYGEQDWGTSWGGAQFAPTSAHAIPDTLDATAAATPSLGTTFAHATPTAITPDAESSAGFEPLVIHAGPGTLGVTATSTVDLTSTTASAIPGAIQPLGYDDVERVEVFDGVAHISYEADVEWLEPHVPGEVYQPSLVGELRISLARGVIRHEELVAELPPRSPYADEQETTNL